MSRHSEKASAFPVRRADAVELQQRFGQDPDVEEVFAACPEFSGELRLWSHEHESC